MCVNNSYSTLFAVVEWHVCVIRVYVCDTCTTSVGVCIIVCVLRALKCMCSSASETWIIVLFIN